MTVSKSGVFISYSRADGEPQAMAVRRRLEAEGIRLWQDRTDMEGGRDWWLQITGALDAVEFMVLVMTPAAAASELVRKEWRYARQHGVCVYPVLAGPVDFGRLPRWMRTLHFYDVEHEWLKLLNDLRTRCEQPRVPFMADDLPPDFVPRPVEFERLLSLVLNREQGEPIAITAALRAAGGYGKTVLARALCHHEDIQNAFDDGILWVTLGQNPGDLTGRVEDLIYLLSGRRPGFAGIEAATAMLVDLLADRDVLIVLDDAWDAAHLRPFLQGGPRCARVITTRVLDAVPADAGRVDVDAMRQDEALALVGHGLADGFAPGLRALGSRLGEWPLLLKLANAALRDRVRSGQTLDAALAYVNHALDRRGLTFFDARDSAARHLAVAKTIELSLEPLSEHERARFTELAVFPEDVDIPLPTLEKLWARTGGLDDLDTESLCERLYRLSLALAFDPAQRFIRLHDVIRQYVCRSLGDRLTVLQSDFLDAHRPASMRWADLAPAEPYLWDHLAYHLRAANRNAELVAAVLDVRYLAAKTLSRNALAAERDLVAAEQAAPDLHTLGLLRRSFVQSSHVFNRCEARADLEATLRSRLQHLESLPELKDGFADPVPTTHLRADSRLPDLPHPALIRTVTGRTVPIWSCAISPDGSMVVSGAEDGVLTVWDTANGVERFRLSGHTAAVRGCAISADGSFIVSAGYDRRARIWDAATGAIRHVLRGHTDGLTDCAISADDRFIVTSSLDETLRVWDAATGTCLRTLSAQWKAGRGGWLRRGSPVGHTAAVWACAISRDGRHIASASSDQTVKIWDAATGQERRTLTGHTAAINGVAFSPDGLAIASSAADRTVRIWDRETGAERLAIEGHAHVVNRCVFDPDGHRIASVSADGTLKVWDAVTGAERASNVGHRDALTGCAFATATPYLVSSSLDGTLKIWDAQLQLRPGAPPHGGFVHRCAVSADGEMAVTASGDMTLRIWRGDPPTPSEVLLGHDDAVRGCAIAASGREIVSASADKSLKIWSADGGSVRFTLLGHRDWVNACSVSPDGRLILSASSDKTLRISDARTRAKRLRFVAHADSINACAFSPDGQFFVSASSDTTLKVWRLDTVRDVWESPLTGENKLNEGFWDAMLSPLVLRGHHRMVTDVAVASDGSFVVSASADRTLKIWDLGGEPLRSTGGASEHGGRCRVLAGHRHEVNGCAISPDGRLIASTSEDSAIKIWEVGSGECLTTLHVDGALSSCAWLPDGQRIIATGAAGVYFLALTVPGPVPDLLPFQQLAR
jgi:WD40 repeat protein